jgi:hypothetical protein
MTFNIQNWGRANTGNTPIVTLQSGAFAGAPNLFTYISASDSLATIAGANYFATVVAEINVGDFIFAVDSTSTSEIYKVSAVDVGAKTITIATAGGVVPAFPLSLALGGTAANLAAISGGAVYSGAAALAITAAPTATGQILSGTIGGAAPVFTTATYPRTTTINQILYSSAANVISGLATLASGVLVTSAGGVPSISTTLPTNLAMQTPASINLTNATNVPAGQISGIIPLVNGGTNADLSAAVSNGGIVWSNATQMQILAGTATASQVLLSGSSATPAWSTATYPATTSINQLLYSSAANVISGLTATANGTLITGAAGIPSIVALANGTILIGTAGAPAASTATYPATTTINQILYSSAANTIGGLATANSATLVTSSAGVPSLLALGAQQSLVGVASGTPAVATIPGVNRLINGDFQVWQRGAGGSAVIAVAASSTVYTADRWQLHTLANQACTVTQNAGAISGSFVATVQRNSGQTGTGTIQFVSTCTRSMSIGAAGNSVTVSFKAKAGANFSAASNTLTVTLVNGTGSTDVSAFSFTGSNNFSTNNQTLTTTLTNYSFTGSCPANATAIAVNFSFTPVGTAGADDSFSITDVQLEVSPTQTAFQRKPFNTVLNECKSFYRKSFAYATAPAQSAGVPGSIAYTAQIASTTTGWTVFEPFTPPMLVAPTITYYNPSASNAKWRNLTGAADSGTAATSGSITITESGVNINNPQVAGDSAGNLIAVQYSADCDLV